VFTTSKDGSNQDTFLEVENGVIILSADKIKLSANTVDFYALSDDVKKTNYSLVLSKPQGNVMKTIVEQTKEISINYDILSKKDDKKITDSITSLTLTPNEINSKPIIIDQVNRKITFPVDKL